MSVSAPRRVLTGALPLIVAWLAACSTDAPPTAPPRSPTVANVGTTATVVVTSAEDDGSPGTLRVALSAAGPGGTITFDPALDGATIRLTNLAIGIAQDVTILGPANGITIDAQGATVVMQVAGGVKLTMKDVTLTNGSAIIAGGLNVAGEADLERVRVVNNRSSDDAGGILVLGKLRIVNGVVSDNTTLNAGGGIHVASGASAEVIATTLHHNLAQAGIGGGISVDVGATALVERSTLSDNFGNGSGGGAFSKGALTIRNSTITGNRSNTGAGGISLLGGTLDLSHSTVAENASTVFAGGIGGTPSQPATLTNVLFARNQTGATNGTGNNCSQTPAPVFVGRSWVDDASCGAAGPTLTVGDPVIGPLADNGGPTKTHAVLVASPVIDVLPTCPLTEDQRGLARPQGAGCEPGAVEFTDYKQLAVTVNGSGTVDRTTGVATVGGTLRCEQAATIDLIVTVRQVQKNKRVSTEVKGTNTITVACPTTATAWAAAVTPPTGAFNNNTAEVKVVNGGPAYFSRVNVVSPSVVMAWSRR